MAYYNRYSKFLRNGVMDIIPFVKLQPKETDKTKVWNKSVDRIDIVSYRYYGHPFGGWLIMLANGQYGQDSTDIPDGVQIRIPFPYNDSIQQYIEGAEKYLRKYSREIT